MDFLKKFFNDEGPIVGLCGFKMTKAKYVKSSIENDFFFNHFEAKKIFETDFKQNVFLEVERLMG